MNSIEKQGLTFEEALKVLAECQAEYNRLGKIVSTKEAGSLRSACDEEARLRYEESGVKSYEIPIAGISVGTYTVCKTQEKPEQKVKRLRISEGNAVRWLMEDAPEEYYKQLCEEAVKLAEDYMLLTGEVIPSARMVEEVLPAEPSRYKNTVLKIDADKLERALEARDAIALEEAE